MSKDRMPKKSRSKLFNIPLFIFRAPLQIEPIVVRKSRGQDHRRMHQIRGFWFYQKLINQ